MQTRTLNDEIQTQINHTIKQQPYPTRCTILKTYPDGYTDINTELWGKIEYVETIGNPEPEDVGVLIFLENDFDKRIVITQTNIPEAE